MTVPSEVLRWSYAGDGSQTVFPYTTKIYADTDLLVVERDDTTLVETTKVLTTDYTVSGAGDENGGNVTMLSAPAVGKTLVIKIDLPFTQGTDYVENDPFPADTHEEVADRAVRLCQMLNEKVGRALLLPLTSSLSLLELPEKTGDARVLGWNGAGTAFTLLTDLEVALSAADEWATQFVLTTGAPRNVGVGYQVLNSVTSAAYSTAFGFGVLRSLTTAMGNTGVGAWALNDCTTGAFNTGVGDNALASCITGQANSAFGVTALSILTTGINNVAIGAGAGHGVITGSANVFIGSNTGWNAPSTTSNKLYIANQDTNTPTIYGELDNHNIGLGLVSFGTNGTRVLGMGTGVAPTTSPADGFQMYSADQAAGNACPHFRTEGGKVIKLYQQAHIADPTDLATCITAIGSILDALEALGLLATS